MDKPHYYTLILLLILIGILPGTSLLVNGQDTAQIISLLSEVRHKRGSDKSFDRTDSVNLYQALSLSRKANWISGQAQCLDILGVRERSRANYSKALEYHLQALSLLATTPDNRFKAIILNNIGVVYRRMDDLVHATEYHLEALKLAEQINDNPNICVSLNSLGNIFTVQEKYADARKYFEQALGKEKLSNNLLGIAINYNNIGGTYKEEKQFTKATEYYRKSLETNRLIGSKKGIAICISDLGDIALKENNVALALEYFTKALELNLAIGDNMYVSNNYIHLGNAYALKRDYQTALVNYMKGLDLALTIGARQNIESAYEGISEVYENEGNSSKALDYYKKASAIKDSIRNETISKYVDGMQITYESGKKDQEIKLLNYKQIQKDRKQKIWVISLLGGCLVLIILVSLIYFNYRLKKRANQSLVNYNKDIEEKNRILTNQKEEILAQRDEIEIKSNQINEAFELIKIKNESITDNIRYAVQIQNLMLPEMTYVRSLLPQSFVYYQPKDIVSGDFYWITKKQGHVVLSVADCTGHGVTGAFMSILGISSLNEIVVEKSITDTSQILNLLREKIIWTLQQGGEFSESKEGIHLVVCTIDLMQNKMQFSGAINSIILIRNNELLQYKGDRMPISIYPDMEEFSSTAIDLQKDDMLYLFSDGYYGQFGGEEDKKFGLVRFRNLINSVSGLNIEVQEQTIASTLKVWKADKEQIDDILVMGIRI